MFIDTNSGFLPKHGQIVCGDVFLSEKINNENRLIAVLSDGLGSGIKANILANMTASMAMTFTIHDQPIERSAKSIQDTLPIDSERKIAYASFTIIDTEFDGKTRIIEYGNPQFLLFRNSEPLEIKNTITKDGDLRILEFNAQIEDRIILFSDGVSQSGIGSKDMPFGWDTEKMQKRISEIIRNNYKISSSELQNIIIKQASLNDSLEPKDDITCAVMYFRHPRKLLICTGPPYSMDKDAVIAEKVKKFPGETVVCGGTTAQIISRELNIEIETNIDHIVSDLPPVSHIKGVDLVTEGILTLGKSAELLKLGNYAEINKLDPARQLVDQFLNHDTISFLTGTKINEAHQDPSLPVELEIRRNVIKKIAYLLENKYLKETELTFI